jgi:hypothetical protein
MFHIREDQARTEFRVAELPAGGWTIVRIHGMDPPTVIASLGTGDERTARIMAHALAFNADRDAVAIDSQGHEIRPPRVPSPFRANVEAEEWKARAEKAERQLEECRSTLAAERFGRAEEVDNLSDEINTLSLSSQIQEREIRGYRGEIERLRQEPRGWMSHHPVGSVPSNALQILSELEREIDKMQGPETVKLSDPSIDWSGVYPSKAKDGTVTLRSKMREIVTDDGRPFTHSNTESARSFARLNSARVRNNQAAMDRGNF